MHFLQWKGLNYERNFIEVCSLGSNWQCAIIGSDNGLALKRHQAIIWTNNGLVYWHLKVSLCLNELTFRDPCKITHLSLLADDGFNTLRPRQNGRHFEDNVFKCIFLNENVLILLKISLKFVPKGPINNIPSLVQVMAWRWPGDKPLSEPMMVSLLTHICVAWPQWVKCIFLNEKIQFSLIFIPIGTINTMSVLI